ncbi:MAG: glyoxalase/bleomycin resistance/dioxygenase family protein [Pseudomonadota bacterium]
MTNSDQRPPVWVGHVAMYSKAVSKTREFMLQIGMRPIFNNDDVAVLEMRGGTHLVVTSNPESELLRGTFDLMVDDIDASHAHYIALGFAPSEIERGQIHDSFTLREPGGTEIVFNSSHVGDLPV